MQCPSCEFQNMPGSGHCARCGSSLALATTAIDVHPPRAGRYQRHVPQFWGLRRGWANFLHAAGQPFAAAFARIEDTNFDLSTILRLVVPGWAHVYRGRRERGIVFFGAYVGFLLPGLILLGTTLGSLLVGLAFGVHVASAVDATVGGFSDFAGRVAFSLFSGLGLIGLIYLPIGYLVSRVATPIQITQRVGEFESGDVLWYDRSAEIVPGDLVYYEVPETSVNGRVATGHAARFVFRDGWINRVAAIEGQTVSWKDGQMLVDGEPSPWQGRVDVDFARANRSKCLRARCSFLPSALFPTGVQLQAGVWRRLSLVSRNDVYGRIYFRSYPSWRIVDPSLIVGLCRALRQTGI